MRNQRRVINRPLQEQTLFSWFSVHRNGSAHAAHAHADARFAAVYYASVPPGSGALVFTDPRSISTADLAFGKSEEDAAPRVLQPPFAGNTFVHRPRAGDLVIFPGWLEHEVKPSLFEDAAGGGGGGGSGSNGGESKTRTSGSGDGSRDDGDGGGYRVSFSFNIHGYWQDAVP